MFNKKRKSQKAEPVTKPIEVVANTPKLSSIVNNFIKGICVVCGELAANRGAYLCKMHGIALRNYLKGKTGEDLDKSHVEWLMKNMKD